ncbi:MAG: peroxidase family protein, partial [Actinomycetota bacterium]
MSDQETLTVHATPSLVRRSSGGRRGRLTRPTRLVAAASALLLPLAMGLPAVTAHAAAPGVGQGFTVTPSDLAFILKQIKIAERHSRAIQGTEPSALPNPSPTTDPNYCQSMVGSGPDQIPDPLTAYGLRTVDGSCNNLIPGRDKFASSDQPFPRYASPVLSGAEGVPAGFFGPGSPAVASSTYAQKKGYVFDSQPRIISNLIADQTSTNPAAVAAAGFPVRTQGDPGLFPCTTDPDPTAVPPVVGVPDKCVPSHQTLFIPNVTTDVGLSPPFNALFTYFGQFFDHGLDQTVKSGGTVFVPLRGDDPLIAGPDHIPGNADDLPAAQRFMVLTRAQNRPGPDGILGDDPATPLVDESADDIQDGTNNTSPLVNQSQTYTSHPSKQVFEREYVLNATGKPVSTGYLLAGSLPVPAGQDPGLPNWAEVKAQAATLLGLKLVDTDVTSVPMLAVDPYGTFIPGPNGLPQYVTKGGLVEGNLTSPVPVPADVLHFDTPFETDIAHNADPSAQDTDNNPSTPPVFPTPDLDQVASADFASQPPGTYDDEMLNAHFVCGDGRCNENIALTSIHQIFHSEHDRLIGDFKNTLTADTSPSGVAALTQWQLPTAQNPGGWNGERLFQAARFVTEMEYQHLVFGEFARKVQPAIQPFKAYHPDINAAIHAEFAHAVYRFGHSMLDEQVARTEDVKGAPALVDHSIPLLTAFLNPPEFSRSVVPGAVLTPQVAAGGILMGSSDQVGNELDEFVTETLRNNLLGLPLDLATVNITRAREAGVPPLNAFRRQIFGAANELKPYTSWADFGQNLKHPESLINFVAAYGKHPTIRDSGPDGVAGTADDVTTVAAKRTAARAIVDPRLADPSAVPPIVADVPPFDAAAFMLSTGAYANTPSGVTTTGVDDIDLWIGGLAEKTNLNGGLLGSTFNYVFENQLTDLQNGDRLYYLARTPGTNLDAQLEGNSFAEMIQRNTAGSANSLKADVFGTADCKFQLKRLDGNPAGFARFGPTVADDINTACREDELLLRKPDGTIQYRQVNTVDPVGVNGQSVYNGDKGVDLVSGGSDNDTFWGDAGNDVIEGGGGNDVALGGDGNDIITDLSGDDILKGGPGNDALDGGIGLDLILGGDGQDFTNGGPNDNVTFGGPGDDFVMAGQGADGVFGDGGDDWIEGGSGSDVLSGDHGAPFRDDPAQVKPGNDILIGQGGGVDTYDAEGGDDVMSSNTSIDQFVGSAGFDWASHQYDTVGADDDMKINIGHALPPFMNRDVWQETEASSGSVLNDVIRGDDTVPTAGKGVGFIGCDALDQAGIDRIAGLGNLVTPTMMTTPAATVAAASATGFCPLVGNVWGGGNILLGGAGSDTLEGRGGDDIIDGDRSLGVRISVRDPLEQATEIGSTDLMEHAATTGSFGPGTGGMTLQQAVFAGLVDPGTLVAVREIKSPAAGTDTASVDTAVFSDVKARYTVTTVPAGATLGAPDSVTTVAHLGGTGPDGTDTLRNIESLQFAGTTTPTAPTGVSAVAGTASAIVSWTAPANASTSSITGYSVRVVDATGVQVGALHPAVAGATSLAVSGLVNGSAVWFQVAAVNDAGTGAFSAPSNVVTPDVVPGEPTIGPATAGNTTATVTWTAPAANGGSARTGYSVMVLDTVGNRIGDLRPAAADANSLAVTGLVNGSAVRFQVAANNVRGVGAFSALSEPVTPDIAPKAPAIGAATAGNTTATVTWTAPPGNGGSARTGYSVKVLDTAGVQVGDLWTTTDPAATSLVVTGLANDTSYTLTVTAFNSAGTSPASAPSNEVKPRLDGAGFTGITPRRVMDTRLGVGVTGKVGSGRAVSLTIPGLPAGTTAVALNVTVVNPTASSYLTVYPAGVVRPVTSNLNFTKGQIIPNMVIVAVSPGGDVTFYNGAGTVDVIADLSGYFTPTAHAGFTGVTPGRVMDTRLGAGVVGKVGAGGAVTLTIPGLPAGTTAVALNVTAVSPTASSYLTVYPADAVRPVTSNLNFTTGQTVPNLVIVAVSPGGDVTFYNNAGTVDVIADLSGYFTPTA